MTITLPGATQGCKVQQRIVSQPINTSFKIEDFQQMLSSSENFNCLMLDFKFLYFGTVKKGSINTYYTIMLCIGRSLYLTSVPSLCERNASSFGSSFNQQSSY